MRFLDTVSIFVLVTNFFSPVLFAQSVSEQRRETYYQNLEARARSLSQKLAEISGTEPIPFHSPKRSVLSTMETNPPNASPQTAYDSLPGPIVEPASTPAPQSETLYRADGTPVIYRRHPLHPLLLLHPLVQCLRKERFVEIWKKKEALILYNLLLE